MRFLRKLLGGAFPEVNLEPLPIEGQYFPDDGIIKAPSTFHGDFGQQYIEPDFEPMCTLLVQTGQTVPAGMSIAEIETSTHIIEVPAPSDLIVDELLFTSGNAIMTDQHIAKVSRAR